MEYIETVYSVLQKWYIGFAAFTPKLIVGLGVFVIVYLLSTKLSQLSVRTIHKFFPKSRQRESVSMLVNLFRFLFILAGVFIAFEIMGLSGFVIKFLGSLGVAGIIAGVALKDIVSSMFSGILVGIDKAFKVGDYVEIDKISGTVEDIGFLTTKLIADDGKKYYIPNQLIFSAPFVNFSASGHRRIFLNFEVPNSEDLDRIKEIIKDEIQHINGVDEHDDIQVVFIKQSLGVYYLNARFWVVKGQNLLKIQSDAYMRIKKRMDGEGISLINPLQNITGNANA